MRHPYMLLFVLVLPLLAACEPEDAGGDATMAAAAGGGQAGAAKAAPATEGDPALDACSAFIDGLELRKDLAGWKMRLNRPPQFTFDADSDYFWDLTTNKGEIRIRLLPDVAPMHVSSTIYLTQLGFYDGLKFHRVIPGFMAQGGCPMGNGMGNPGYKMAGEFDPAVRHDAAGKVSMANSGPNTDGSQFFITFAPQPALDGKYTIFGEVVEGMATVKKLDAAGNPDRRANGVPPLEPLGIEQAVIVVAPREDAAGG